MKTIWKFPLQITDRQTCFLPKGARILTVQFQDYDLCMWAEVDPKELVEPVGISVYGTGNPVENKPGIYLATVQRDGLVWHVYRDEQ